MKKIRFISLLLIAVLIFTACGTDFYEELGLGSKGNRLGNKTIYLIGYNFENENPLLVKNEVNREIFSLIYDGLYTLSEDYTPVPRLAKNMFPSEDLLKWTIDLNTNAYFHDGTAISANDVSATINYLLNNATYYSYNIRNIESVTPYGTSSVVLHLKEPSGSIASLLTFPIINSKELLGEFKLNGTGMFVVDNYIKRKFINLKINDNYYGKKNEEISKIEVQLMPDKETAGYSYGSGLADVFSQDIFSDSLTSGAKSGSSLLEYVSLNYNFLILNHQKEIFKDKEVRKAINSAIDKERIVTDVLFSHGETVSTPIHRESALYLPEAKDEYNVNEAKNILEKTGYTPDLNSGILKKENEKLSFSILVNNDNNFRIQVANLISDNLKYVGIDASVKIVSFEEYKSEYFNKTYDAFLGSVAMSPDFDLTMFMGEGNVSNYESVRAKELINSISLTFDLEERKEKYKELQKIFMEDISHISLYYTKANLKHTGKIKKGLKPTGYNIFTNIENWSFEE